MLCAMQMAVPAFAAVTIAVETLVPQAVRLWLKQVSEARKLVSASSQDKGCWAGKIHRKRYPLKVQPSG